MHKAIFLLLLLTACVTSIYAQDISGEWKGNYTGFLNMTETRELIVNIELVDDKIIKGYSYLKYGGERHEKYVIEGIYYKEDSLLIFSEVEEISVNLGALGFGGNVPGTYTMKLSVKDSIMRLYGKWKEEGSSSFGLMNSKVWLEKKIPYSPPVKKIESDSSKEITEQLKRNTEIQRIIELDEEESQNIQIEIVDNAKIDGDVISVYINDGLIINKQSISEVPLKQTFSVNEDSTVLKMSAISIGSMPPCTAQMTIITSKNRHVFELSGNFTRNAAVEFRLK